MKNQSYKNFELVVTKFGENLVDQTIEEYGLNFRSFETKTNCQVSFTEFAANGLKQIEKDLHIYMFTNADHVFPEDFLEKVARALPVGSSGTVFPQIVYGGPDDFEASRSLFNFSTEPNGRMPFPYHQAGLQDWKCADPNQWVQDIIFMDGNLVIENNLVSLFKKYHMNELWPGQAHNVMLGFVAPQESRYNLFFKTQYSEILNNYGISPTEGTSYNEIRKHGFRFVEENLEKMHAFAREIGISTDQYLEVGFNKIRQCSEYKVLGSPEEIKEFDDYLSMWRKKYIALQTPQEPTKEVSTNAAWIINKIKKFARRAVRVVRK